MQPSKGEAVTPGEMPGPFLAGRKPCQTDWRAGAEAAKRGLSDSRAGREEATAIQWRTISRQTHQMGAVYRVRTCLIRQASYGISFGLPSWSKATKDFASPSFSHGFPAHSCLKQVAYARHWASLLQFAGRDCVHIPVGAILGRTQALQAAPLPPGRPPHPMLARLAH